MVEDKQRQKGSGKKGRRKKTNLAEKSKAKPGKLKEIPQHGRGADSDESPNDVKNDDDLSNQCSVCGKDFTSRTKMFQHIRSSGHAALKG